MKLQLYYPLNPYIVTQKFGETAYLSYYLQNGISFPGHNGIDLGAMHGQPIYAAHDGTAYYEVDGNQGHGVIVITNEQFDYAGGQCYFKTIYWHLVDPEKEPQYTSPIYGHSLTNQGVKVKAGDIIGYANSSGLSTGTHLHFGLKPVAQGEDATSWFNVLQNNGYMGAIDPNPYLIGQYAPTENKPFVFTKNMKMDDDGEDVRQLQLRLQRMGYFPPGQACTGHYGPITRYAVFLYQQDHIKLSWLQRNIYKGMYCYEATRNSLNLDSA